MCSHRFFTFSVYCVVIVFTAFTCVNFVPKKHFKSDLLRSPDHKTQTAS